jgi:hypothetical protein
VARQQYQVGNILGLKQPDLAGEAMETLLAYHFAEATLDGDYCLNGLHFMRSAKGISFYDAACQVMAEHGRRAGDYGSRHTVLRFTAIAA